MLCGTFKKKRRSPGEEYRLVRSNTMPRIVSTREGSLVAVRRTKSSRATVRSFLIKDLLNMVSLRTRSNTIRFQLRKSIFLFGADFPIFFFRMKFVRPYCPSLRSNSIGCVSIGSHGVFFNIQGQRWYNLCVRPHERRCFLCVLAPRSSHGNARGFASSGRLVRKRISTVLNLHT